MDNKKPLYCVIMAGGIGTRFWPESRQSKPKQFLDICDTGKSFLRMTYERFAHLVPTENFLVVTNTRYKELVLEHIPELRAEQGRRAYDVIARHRGATDRTIDALESLAQKK